MFVGGREGKEEEGRMLGVLELSSLTVFLRIVLFLYCFLEEMLFTPGVPVCDTAIINFSR